MPVSIEQLARVDPDKTILFFGAGSSVQSGAPSVSDILGNMSSSFGIPNDYSLAEMSSLVEEKCGRHRLIEELRRLISKARPTGSLLNVPLYPWRSIYTTNYDELIEQSYDRNNSELSVYSSNFDFTIHGKPSSTKLYKLHGTVSEDVTSGHQSRMIITEGDYDLAREYREFLLQTLSADMAHSNLIIIGYSLGDAHIKELVELAIKTRSTTGQARSVSLLVYQPDENRALLYEKRGLRVAFGSLDNFFVELAKHDNSFEKSTAKVFESLLDEVPQLRPVTIDVVHDLQVRSRNARALFNGKAASYADVKGELTFRRPLSREIQSNFDNHYAAILLGASGTGKTSLARQILVGLHESGWECWEHKEDHTLQPSHWRGVAKKLQHAGKNGVLFIDDAHSHLFEANKLIDYLVSDENNHLRLMLASPSNHWNPRTKSINFHVNARTHVLRKLSSEEINSLLNLADSNAELGSLIDSGFRGFSRAEKYRRLTVRCESDTFVCLRNIFSTEKFDDIILREYAALQTDAQSIYRLVSAMESSGVKVHRQLVTRIAAVDSNSIARLLDQLQEIVYEYTVSERDGIYGWKVRHPVIGEIVTRYKYSDLVEFESLFSEVIDNIVPTYEIEIRTLRQLCNFDSGIGRLSNLETQNQLYRKMISVAPGERVPRHRLIRNLIRMRDYEKAETEIKLFENDFKKDGPVERYSVRLMLARAENVIGLMEEDRVAILKMAESKALNLVDRQPENRDMLRVLCEVGIAFVRRNGRTEVFETAMEKLKNAEARTGDPDLSKLLTFFERERTLANDFAAIED